MITGDEKETNEKSKIENLATREWKYCMWKIEITEQVLEERSITQEIQKCPLLKKKRRTREGNVMKVREEQSIEVKVLTGPERLGSKNMTED